MEGRKEEHIPAPKAEEGKAQNNEIGNITVNFKVKQREVGNYL